MKKTSILAVAALIVGLCSSSYAATNAKKNVKKNAEKEWTLAVFLNADNNLDRFGVADQEEMSKVGSSDFLNIVSLIDRENGPAQINYIEKDKINKLKDMGELDMGDYKEFVKFVKFVKENYPAKHYCFSFWNHGSGWKDKNDAASVLKGISYDDSSHNHISTNDLTVALAEANKILGKKIDMLCFDACLMQMVEVAYAAKDHVDYMVGSEETEPGKGAPYDDILKTLKKGMGPKEFAINWVNAFGDSYNGGSQGKAKSTQSALEMSKLPQFIDAINGFAKVGMAKDYSRFFRQMNVYTQKYAYPDNMDLLHFVELMTEPTGLNSLEELKKQYVDEALKTAIKKLQAAGKQLIIANRFTTPEAQESKGIAIFFPTSYYCPWLYQDLAFAKETLWDDMIEAQGGFATLNKISEDVKKGDLDSLSKLVKEAKKDPKNKIYRRVLVQLNYIADNERAVPAKSKAEFENLRNGLKSAITK